MCTVDKVKSKKKQKASQHIENDIKGKIWTPNMDKLANTKYGLFADHHVAYSH